MKSQQLIIGLLAGLSIQITIVLICVTSDLREIKKLIVSKRDE